MKGDKMKFRDYANLTNEQREEIIKTFRYARDIGATDAGHASAIAAGQGLQLTDRQWNGKTGSNAWAATLATLVMAGEIELSYKN